MNRYLSLRLAIDLGIVVLFTSACGILAPAPTLTPIPPSATTTSTMTPVPTSATNTPTMTPITLSTVVPIDLTDEITISNGDFELTIYQISIIESMEFEDRSSISLKDSAREKYNLYEIRMRYTNLTDTEGSLGYRQLRVSLPAEEEIGDNLAVVGYCEPRTSNPKGDATFCAYLPPSPQPGEYGIIGVYQASPLLIQPGEQAEFIIIVILAKIQPELVIAFIEPE